MSQKLADPFMTLSEVLGCLRVNVKTVYRLIGTGELPAVRIGRQWRVRPHDLDLWLRRHESGATLDPEPAGGTPGTAPAGSLGVPPVQDGANYSRRSN